MRGAWVGLTRHHTRAHLVRSVLEGVAYEYAEYLRILRELHPEIDLREVRVVGGGARSDTWNAIKASALGVPYARPARGRVLLLGRGARGRPGGRAVRRPRRGGREATAIERRFEPDPDEHEVLARQAGYYARLLETLDPGAA